MAPLRDVWVAGMLWLADLEGIDWDWEDEIDMPRIRYDSTRPRYVLGLEMW